jgi:hypothetical protein
MVAANETSSPASLVKISPNRRYLVDSNDTPFLIHGDTAWSLISALNAEEVEQYLANRAAKGFNSIIVNLIEHKFNGPTNRFGEDPFTTPGDFTTPNEEYFAFADWCVERAAEHGIQILLAPIYLGSIGGNDEGWYDETIALSPAKCREWGCYVGNRNPGAALDHVEAVAKGIKEYDDRHLFTAHVRSEHSPVIEYAQGGWVDLDCTYSYGIVHRRLLADYRREPVRPLFLIESTYEGEHNASAVQVRRQAYWAILCGGCGHFFGNLPVWGFYGPGADMRETMFFDNEGRGSDTVCGGWQVALESTGAWDMVHLKALFSSRDWYNLVPDQQHVVVTRGLGEYTGLDYVAAARTDDDGTVIAYMPSARTITVDLTKVCGKTALAWWFDPRTGEAQSAGEFSTSGNHDFAPPADGDWVLVLDDAERGYPAPGARD